MLTIRATLEQLVEKHAASDDSMPFHCIHGFLTALTISPKTLPRTEVIQTIMGGKSSLDETNTLALNKALDGLQNDIDRSFNDEGGFTLSCEPTQETESEEELSLENWCAGFMEAHFMTEAAWFEHHEQEVCELLLPVMLASGLFDHEPEFQDILNNESLANEMCSQIPEVLMELYLMFNSPEDIRSQNNNKPTR